MADAVSLAEAAGISAKKKAPKPSQAVPCANFRTVVVIFVVFMFVVSDVFTNNVVSGFSGAVACRSATPLGTAIQGVFLVVFYILALYLIDQRII